MLAANSYGARPSSFMPYRVTWDASRDPAGDACELERVLSGLAVFTSVSRLVFRNMHLESTLEEPKLADARAMRA
jgi:hypothetical protein